MRCRTPKSSAEILFAAGAKGFQHIAKTTTHRNQALAAPSLRCTEFTVRVVLGDFDSAAEQVHTFPTHSEDFANPYSGKHRKLNNLTARIR